MRNKLKKTIFLLIIIVILCIIALYYISNRNKKNRLEDYSKDSELVDIEVEEKPNKLEYEKNKNIYYTVTSIVEEYIDSILNGDADKLLSMLDYRYIKEDNINKENVLNILKTETIGEYKYLNYIATTIYSINNSTVSTHFIYGYYYPNSDITSKVNLNLMLELDSVNQTFNIYPYSYMKDKNYENLKPGDSIQSDKSSIENRENNIFNYINITEQEMIEKYLKDYGNKVLFDTDSAYEVLDEIYSEKKFGSKKEFDKYIDNKKVEISIANIEQYEVTTSEDGNNIYACKDQNENYYYFIEINGVMNYKVKLDNYTVPDEEHINKYENMDGKAKAVLNISKFIKSINDKSCYYAYNCLSEGFKNNYFKTLDEFETYVKNNFFDSNQIEFEATEEQGGLYKCKVKIINDENIQEYIEKSFIMKLNEGTDFEMSFNVN